MISRLIPRAASRPGDPPPVAPASHPGAGPEGSIRLRLAVLANTLIAFLAYGMVDVDVEVVLPMLAACAGMAFSHWRRSHRNLLLKWVLAAGMLFALWSALGNLVRGAVDPRLALGQLLFWLQVLNSFDLPRRRNLRVAVLVAAVLMVVTGTMSRTIDYGALLLLYGLTLIWASYEAFAAETGTRPERPARTLGLISALLAFVLVLATPLFMLAPRKERQLSGASLPISIYIPTLGVESPRIRSSAQADATGGTSGTGGAAQFGTFAEALDLNTRSAPSEEVILRIQSDRPQYWRAVAYDSYDGRIWSMSRPDEVTPFNVASPPMRLGRLPGQAPGTLITQTVYVERDQANLVFAAWTPTAIYFPTSLLWRDHYGNLRSPVMLQKDMYYSVISEAPVLKADVLMRKAARPVPASRAHYLALPKLAPRVREAARRAAGGARSPYAIMVALRDHLALTYPYALDVPTAPAGVECVEHFLFDQKKGFCQQFATTLAVMGRVNGVPTRLVTGFAPGDYNPFTGLWEVKGKHAHAWIEAWVPSVGWVPFDATPASWLPDFGQVDQVPGSTMLTALAQYLGPLARRWGWVLAALATVAGAWGLRRRRAAKRRDAVSQATQAYRRLRRRLAQRGVPDRPGDAPREWLAGAREVPDVAPAMPTLSAFVARYEAARFSGVGGGAEADAEVVALARRAEAELGPARRS